MRSGMAFVYSLVTSCQNAWGSLPQRKKLFKRLIKFQTLHKFHGNANSLEAGEQLFHLSLSCRFMRCSCWAWASLRRCSASSCSRSFSNLTSGSWDTGDLRPTWPNWTNKKPMGTWKPKFSRTEAGDAFSEKPQETVGQIINVSLNFGKVETLKLRSLTWVSRCGTFNNQIQWFNAVWLNYQRECSLRWLFEIGHVSHAKCANPQVKVHCWAWPPTCWFEAQVSRI